jgi:hypothetical protein
MVPGHERRQSSPSLYDSRSVRAFALPFHDPVIAGQHAVRRDQITSGGPSYTNAILIASRGAERTGDNSVSLTLSFFLIVR